MQATAASRRKAINRNGWIQLLLTFGGLLGLIVATHVYQPLDHDYFSICGLMLFFLPFGILAYVRRQAKRNHVRPSQVSTYLFLGCPLVFAIVLANGALDFSKPEQKNVLVSRKYVVHGKSTSYVVRFASWRKAGDERIDVTAQVFSEIRAGEPIAMDVHRGLLGFTWVSGVRPLQQNSSSW